MSFIKNLKRREDSSEEEEEEEEEEEIIQIKDEGKIIFQIS
jgi:hypothetical protein